MAEDTETMNTTETITPAARFYRLHRDQVLAQKKEAYNLRPDVIAKREEKERTKEERALAREEARIVFQAAANERRRALKQDEKAKKLQEMIVIAEKTKRVTKKTKPQAEQAAVDPPAS